MSENPDANFYIVSELNNVLQSGYCEYLLGYDIVNWFVDEIIQLENRKIFLLQIVRKMLY